MADQPPPPPQWAPPTQPGWGAPPPGAWGQPGYSAPPPRPIGVTLGAIYLIVMGILVSLAGGCTVMGGALIGQVGSGTNVGSAAGAFGGVFAGLGIIILILGILSIVAGAGALGGKGWGRWIGIILSAIYAVLLILGGVATMSAQNGLTVAVGQLVIGILYALTAFALITAGPYFSHRR